MFKYIENEGSYIFIRYNSIVSCKSNDNCPAKSFIPVESIRFTPFRLFRTRAPKWLCCLRLHHYTPARPKDL